MVNQGEFQQFVLAFLVLFLHRIAVFGEAEIPCNRTCGSKTVNYPFGFSGACPYMLDSNCSESGDIYLKGFQVLDFTNSSIIIQPWQSENKEPKCYEKADILSIFQPQFGLTNRNILLLESCTTPDCKFDIADFRNAGSKYYDGRKNCSNMGLNMCLSNTSGSWLAWNSLKGSTCSYFVSSFIYLMTTSNGSITLDVDKLDLGWWLNGTCHPNPCSANATCSPFQNPNNNNETVHRCYCNQGFQGDGYSEGLGCQKVSGFKTPANRSLNSGKHSKALVPICLFIAGSATVVGIVLLYCCYQRSSCAFKTRISTKRLLSAPGGPLSIPVYAYREMEIATKGFSDKERLGTGGFGTVYLGKLPGKSVVAVKKIRHRDTKGMEQVLNEIRLLSSVDHPNLVRLLGCCLEKGEPILVYEFMPNGTLSQHLQKERGEGLSWRTRVTIAAETAHALAYLHSSINPPIYHRDVKSSNILLDYGFNAKVADFGLCRLVLPESSHISTAPQGTPGYLDPHYHENFQLTDKSDVYSFGVVLAEIITALQVVDFSRKDREINLAFLAVKKIGGGCIDEIIDPFLEVDKDTQVRVAVHRVAELAFRCLSFDRDARPTMVEVAQELDFIACDKSNMDSSDSTEMSVPLPWSTRMKIALGAAKGLAFLHGAEKPVIYRDFKTSNILLDTDYAAKLSDFGLAKGGPEGDKTHVSTRVMGTYGYAAPEYVMTGHLTARSDVYSFGVVLLELLTGRRSMDKTRPSREYNLAEWARPLLNEKRKLLRILDPRMEGEYSVKGALKAANLAYHCLSQNPKARPLMKDVVETLEPLQMMTDMENTAFTYSVDSGVTTYEVRLQSSENDI